jgi:hypothetical protein
MGVLRVSFDSGRQIVVPTNRAYGNWQIVFPDGRKWIGVPGGGIARPPDGHASLPFRVRVKHDLAMEDRGRWWVFDRPLWRDPLFVIGIGVGLTSVVSVILLRDEYGTGAFVFALLTSLPAGVFASGVVIGTPREYMRGRRQRTP